MDTENNNLLVCVLLEIKDLLLQVIVLKLRKLLHPSQLFDNYSESFGIILIQW